MMKKRKGYELLSMVGALIIIAIFVTISAPNSYEIMKGGNYSATKTAASALLTNIQQYSFELNVYPESLDDLTVKNGSFGPWTTEEALKDRWNNDFQYSYDEQSGKIAVWSYGPDGANNSGDGISSDFSGDDIGVTGTIILY